MNKNTHTAEQVDLYAELTKNYRHLYSTETLVRAFDLAWRNGHANGIEEVKEAFADIIWVLNGKNF